MINLYQDYGNNRPYVSHGSYYVFRITVTDTALLKEGKTFDVLKDSLLINCYYRFKSFANKEKDKADFRGTIKIISVSSDKIVIQQNVIINSEWRKNKETIIKNLLFFDGVVTFAKINN